VLGCSTGNGFEHIDTTVTRSVVGIDINPEYLRVLQSRFGQKISGLKLLCSDIAECELEPRSIDLVHCALVLEYVDPSVVAEKAESWLRPGGCLSVVLQLASPAHDKVTDSGFESVKRLEAVMHLIEPDELGRIAGKAGLRGTSSRIDTLESGKRFYVGLYEKAGT
jgi:ubiquinone/menaquinone biosynthesis C-methylase UbiE